MTGAVLVVCPNLIFFEAGIKLNEYVNDFFVLDMRLANYTFSIFMYGI